MTYLLIREGWLRGGRPVVLEPLYVLRIIPLAVAAFGDAEQAAGKLKGDAQALHRALAPRSSTFRDGRALV